MLNEIKEKLETIDSQVYYGIARSPDNDLWNYIVFARNRLARKDNRTGFSKYFTVAIVREDFIPEGLDQQVIEAMESIAGMRLAFEDCEFEYAFKPNTDIVVEIETITFVKAGK